jgi:hypothetical protein
VFPGDQPIDPSLLPEVVHQAEAIANDRFGWQGMYSGTAGTPAAIQRRWALTFHRKPILFHWHRHQNGRGTRLFSKQPYQEREHQAHHDATGKREGKTEIFPDNQNVTGKTAQGQLAQPRP